ncbi:MAG: hypothetical protein RBR50_00320 [Candidatus Izemoplasmatales bacterium]|nr:hypothetical protein [Candidatus Izemoplasmatales bacterium]
MENKRIIVGKIKIGENDYYSEIIDMTLNVKFVHVLSEERKLIIDKIIAFFPEARGKTIFYLKLGKLLQSYYSYESYEILLVHRDMGDKKTYFELLSKGLVNALNIKEDNPGDFLEEISKKINCPILECEVNIKGNKYKCSFVNRALITKNNLCPAEFITGIQLVPLDGKFEDKFYDVYQFSLKLIQFVSLDTYTKIDSFVIYNDIGGYSEIEFPNNNDKDIDLKNNQYLSLNACEENLPKLLELFPDKIVRQHNLYHYKKEWVYEFDIVRMSGAFEDSFKEYVEKDKKYKDKLKKKQDEMFYKELSDLITKFAKEHNIKQNDDYNACRHMFDIYSGTLKFKLEYVLNDFCKTLDFIIVDTSYFYSPSKLEIRLKDARNAIAHGLHDKPIDWKNAANDTIVLQELIYFILLKYKAKLTNKQIKNTLSLSSFEQVNRNASFYKKDDPRIKWNNSDD